MARIRDFELVQRIEGKRVVLKKVKGEQDLYTIPGFIDKPMTYEESIAKVKELSSKGLILDRAYVTDRELRIINKDSTVLLKSKRVDSRKKADSEMNRLLGNTGQYVTENTGVRNVIYKRKTDKKVIGSYNDVTGILKYDPKEMMFDRFY